MDVSASKLTQLTTLPDTKPTPEEPTICEQYWQPRIKFIIPNLFGTGCRRRPCVFRAKRERTVEVIVRSRKVPAHVVSFPFYNSASLTIGACATPVRAVEYKRELDEGQRRLLKSAREFADAQGFGFHVHDVSAENMIHRAFRRLASGGKFVPKMMVHGPHGAVSPGPSVLKLGSIGGKGVSQDGR
jgi:hypothetical protein